MSKKRGNGEGSIIKRKDGLWSAYISNVLDPSTGKLKRKYFYGKTQQEVIDKLRNALNKQHNGFYSEPSKLLLKDYLPLWLSTYKKVNLRPSTYESYEYIISKHIVPSLGTISLKDLNSLQIQKFYNQKFTNGRLDSSNKSPLSSRTVKYIHTILKQALDQAVKNNLIEQNPAINTSTPKKQSKSIRVLSLEEQQIFLDSLQNQRLGVAFKLALGSGARLGELLALQWDDVNLKESYIYIQRSLKRVNMFDPESKTKTKLIFQEPKTKAGKRIIPIPPSIILELNLYKRSQNAEKLLLGNCYNDNNLVFCTELGKPIEPRNFTRLFHSLLEKSHLDNINFHALRHTYATRLLEVNEHPKVVQELLGHSSITMTLDIYSHVMPEVKQAAANKIDILFTPSNKVNAIK